MFDEMTADVGSNQIKPIPIVTKLFLRGRKFNILLFFISQSYFLVPKTINCLRFNNAHYFIMKIHNDDELSKIV